MGQYYRPILTNANGYERVYNRDIDNALLSEMKADGLYEICPEAPLITPEKCKEWHAKGFSVRAWGVANVDLMQKVYFAGADGMTVNFPDKLVEYMSEV